MLDRVNLDRDKEVERQGLEFSAAQRVCPSWGDLRLLVSSLGRIIQGVD